MHYKIENVNSSLYKKLYDFRLKERQIDDDNLKLIIKKFGSDYTSYLGNRQVWKRCKTYKGFEFIDKININGWKACEDAPEIFIPNKKSKIGRKIQAFLDALPTTTVIDLLDLLDIELTDFSFKFPFLEIVDEGVLILFLDKNHIPSADENLIEISKKEFDDLYSTYLWKLAIGVI